MSAVGRDAANDDAADKHVSELATLYRLTDRLYRARSASEIYDAALEAIADALDCPRASILLFDEHGVMRFVASRGLSPGYRQKLEGHTPWKPGEPDPQPILVSDIDATDEPDWIKAAIRKEGIRALGFVPLVAKGATVGKFMTYYEAPRSFSAHEVDLAVTIARQVGFSVERARAEQARLAAEAEARESEERFHLMSEHAPVMIWMSDRNGKCLHLNKLLRDFWGVAEDEIAAFDWGSTIHPDDAADVGRTMMDAIAKGSSVSVKARYRDAKGGYRVLQTDARPRLSNGVFMGMIGVNIDITEREQAETARRQAEAHRELLVAELNHRVKNTLSVVQAIAHQTFQDTADEACRAFNGRLIALARSHGLLTQSNWENVSLEELAANALQLHDGRTPRVTIGGPPVTLHSKQAVAFGLAFHELFTNALKYGALSNVDGTVSATWTVGEHSPRRLHLTWREQGGPPVTPPTRRGFGSMLLERILKGDLNAEVKLDYRPEGLVCTIEAEIG
ncbi:MAG: sensor histidine kinase [Pseudolabrys sp.]